MQNMITCHFYAEIVTNIFPYHRSGLIVIIQRNHILEVRAFVKTKQKSNKTKQKTNKENEKVNEIHCN